MSTPTASNRLSWLNTVRSLIGNSLAVLSFALSLVFPATLAIQDAWIAIDLITKPSPEPFPWAVFVYNSSDYYALPAILAAFVIGAVALHFNPPWQRMAMLGLRVGAASLLFLAAVLALLLSLQAAHVGAQ